jgi:pimeloyl-ACP methyl ester carboxylesterase
MWVSGNDEANLSIDPDRTSRQVKLTGGRTLAYADYGDPNGRPVFFFHGGNDSRLAGALLDEAAARLGIRIIAPDRPGYGRSDFLPGRRFLDWPADVSQLAGALGIERFAVIGHSGGGPHVAALAVAMPERLAGTAMVSSAAPPGSSNQGLHPMFRLINFAMARSGWLHRKLTEQTNKQLRDDPDRFFKQWARASKADGLLFEGNPAARAMIQTEMVEALRQGIDHILLEHKLYKRPWGFDLANISSPVQVWHGLDDAQAAPGWSRYLAQHIPHNETHFVPSEGHFSLLVNQQVAIFQSLESQG